MSIKDLVIIKTGFGHNRYDDGGCEEESQCYMCNFKQYPKATLRGLCENKIIDVFYNVLWDEDTNLPYYRYLFQYVLSNDTYSKSTLRSSAVL